MNNEILKPLSWWEKYIYAEFQLSVPQRASPRPGASTHPTKGEMGIF